MESNKNISKRNYLSIFSVINVYYISAGSLNDVNVFGRK